MIENGSPYIIGIDLGTTNCCLSYVDTKDVTQAIQILKIPQITSPGVVESLTTLPSVCYLPSPQEWPENAMSLPWKKGMDKLIGAFAQSQGAKVPTKLIQSAKSWLCHPSANRKDKTLPFEAANEERKLSPVEATAEYLLHLKNGWNYLMAKNKMEAEFDQQDIILTVPASFDEVARRLTVEAAKLAGYINLTLLEEPQAAFYAWISLNKDKWNQFLKAGDSVLVCDVGGGTTDFSLISVEEKDNKPVFNRLAVGEHLLLGGDNMDSTIAHFIEQKIFSETGKTDLQSSQWLQLKHQARSAKEKFFDAKDPLNTYTILIQGAGSSVVGGSLSTIINREEIVQLLLNGFFEAYPLNKDITLKRSSAIRTMGLAYEEDPSITKHLSNFLLKANFTKAPEHVLFNGGTMKASAFQEAIINSIKCRFPESSLKTLESSNLDTAVSRGAAYYGKVRRGFGVRIGGGIPKAYYLGVDVKGKDGNLDHHALTLLPRGSEEGTIYEPEQSFYLRPNTPVSFNIYTSQVRLHDQAGSLIAIDEKELQSLPPIHTLLRVGKKQSDELILVRLHIGLTPIGTLELWLQALQSEHRWGLEFQVRSLAGNENNVDDLKSARTDEIFDSSFLEPAKEFITSTFLTTSKNVKVMETLEKLTDKAKKDWSLSVLRSLADTLLTVSNQRKVTADLEKRWWNMAGFFSRPGFGFPIDDFRIKELWKIILEDSKQKKTLELQIQQWICFRRISGGFNKGQQQQLANEMLQDLLPTKNSKIVLKTKSEEYPYSEKLRALASFELLDNALKIKLGKAVLDRIQSKQALPVDYWAIGRLGSRRLLYGSFQNVVSPEECTKWIETLLKLPVSEAIAHSLVLLARRTDVRDLNISQSMIEEILIKYHAYPSLINREILLHPEKHFTLKEQEELFGDQLPAGLILI